MARALSARWLLVGGRGGAAFLDHTLFGGDSPGILSPGCGGVHGADSLPLKCGCPPVGGQSSTHELSMDGLRWPVCDGGYGREAAGLAVAGKLRGYLWWGGGRLRKAFWLGRGSGMRDFAAFAECAESWWLPLGRGGPPAWNVGWGGAWRLVCSGAGEEQPQILHSAEQRSVQDDTVWRRSRSRVGKKPEDSETPGSVPGGTSWKGVRAGWGAGWDDAVRRFRGVESWVPWTKRSRVFYRELRGLGLGR